MPMEWIREHVSDKLYESLEVLKERVNEVDDVIGQRDGSSKSKSDGSDKVAINPVVANQEEINSLKKKIVSLKSIIEQQDGIIQTAIFDEYNKITITSITKYLKYYIS